MRKLLLALPLFVACSGSTPKEGWSIEELTREQLDGLRAHADADPEEEGELLEDSGRDLRGGTAAFAGPSGGVPPGRREPATANAPARDAKKKDAGSSPGTWRRSPLAAHTSRLRVGDKEELPLEATHVTVRVDGFRARVALDLYFRNDRDQRLQGMLKLRLPDGASPDYTAFGVAAKIALPEVPGTSIPSLERRHASLKQARMVPRARAARAYTDTVRRSVDPALVEWAGAGIYNVRVFPLEPGKVHQISIAYDLDLTPVGDDLVYRLELPEKTGELEIVLDAPDATVNGAAAKEGRFRFRNPGERVFEARLASPGDVVLTGRDPAAGPLWAARVTPRVPDEAGDPAENAIFLVDTSLSSNPDRLNVWLELMDRILERNRATLKRYRVGFFDVGFHWWRDGAVDNTAATARALQEYAKSLVLEGATDLGAALAAAAAIEGRHDVFLLSDGAITWGCGDADELPLREDHTLFAYRTGIAGGDSALLAKLAQRSGGAAFATSDASGDLAVAHAKRPWRIAGVEAPGADVLVRGRPTAIFPGQSLVVCGRGAFDGAIRLRLAQGERTITVASEGARSIESPLTASVYGQCAVAQLEDAGAAVRDASRAYAQHFRVVGRTCSLVMLETEEDYQRYGIVPEDDAGYVAEHPAAAIVEDARSPEDPLRAWIEALGLVKVDGALAAALENADDAVPSAPLAAKTRLWTEIPGAFTEQLASRKLKLADVEAEAARRRELHGAADGLKALSSRVEQNPGDWDVTRDVAYTALEWGEPAAAYHLFRRVAEARPFEPHNFLAMARCLEGMDRIALAKVWYEVALAGEWDQRFGEFRRIATVHYLSFLRRHRDARLETLVPAADPKTADLLVTILWNTDNSDVDLHVLDADGEQCSYSNTVTDMGGWITKDVTRGYGPEMFVQPEAKPGTYAIWAHYFAQDSTRLSCRTRVFATIFENFGRADEKSRTISLILETGKQEHPIAKMTRSD